MRLRRERAVGGGCLAQLVERRPYKANVGGSIPSAPTSSASERRRGAVVQLVRIPACHAGGRGFESRPLRQDSRKANRGSPFCLATFAPAGPKQLGDRVG